MDQNLLAGVDIGGTKTRIMGRRGGVLLFDETLVTDAWRTRQMEADAVKLAAIVLDLSGGSAPAAIAVGAHGCDTDEQCLRFQAMLSVNLKTNVQVVNDAELMVPAAGYDDGIGVVAGTGSIAVARTAEGKMLAAGGWGWILGDEGSAAALVREAAKAIRRALDRGQDGDPLIAMLMREIGTDDQTKLGILLNETRGAAAWGRYANAVFYAATAGSALASRVIQEGGEGLAALVQLLIERGASASLVVAGGGVIAEQPMLMEAFVKAMASVSPASRVVLLREPPVIGAVALAGRLVAARSVATAEGGSRSIEMKRIGYRPAVSRQVESLELGRQAVARALDALDLSGFAGGTIGFAGIGASYQAALAGAFYLRQLGRRGFAFVPTELYGRTDAAADAFVALSASGQSREIADVMLEAKAYPRLAICRGADNPLAGITGAVIAMESGADNGASSTGYTGTLLALGMLIDKGAGASFDWAQLPMAVERLLADGWQSAARAARLLAGRASIDIVGAGIGFANAGEAAMLIREAVRVPASGWDTMNYLHGPMESQDAATGLIAFGEDREVKIAQDVAGFGCPSVLITRRTDIAATEKLAVIVIPTLRNAMADGILEIIALQMIVADMQDAAGLTDITFRYRQTDTKLKPWSPTEL